MTLATQLLPATADTARMQTARNPPPAAALGALVGAGVLWGLTLPISSFALSWLDPAWLTTARFALAAPVLAILARRSLRDALSPAIVMTGGIGLGGLVLLQNLGLERTSVAHGALILGAVPALVAVLVVATGHGRASRRAWIGFGIALLGVGLIAESGGDASLAGDALIFASAALFALYIVAQSRLLGGRDPLAVVALQMAAAALVTLPDGLSEGLPARAPRPSEIVAVVALAGAAATAYALYAYAQTSVAPEVAGAFTNLEPLVAATIGVVVFHAAFGPAFALGAMGILAGIVLSLERVPRPRLVPAVQRRALARLAPVLLR